LNCGEQPLSNLTLTWQTGKAAETLSISPTTIASLAPGRQATITITPKEGSTDVAAAVKDSLKVSVAGLAERKLRINYMVGAVNIGDIAWLNYNLGADESLDAVEQIKAWRDQNATTSTTDYTVMGDLYQWSRAKDGHQLRSNSTETASTSVTLSAEYGQATNTTNFITGSSTYNYDWRISYPDGSTQDNPPAAWRWNDGTTKQANDPCPESFRVPTAVEWTDLFTQGTTLGDDFDNSAWPIEVGEETYYWIKIADGEASTNWVSGATTGGLVLVKGTDTDYDVDNETDASNTVFFLPATGMRSYAGLFGDVGTGGYYWSSTPYSSGGYALYFYSGDVSPALGHTRVYGLSVRCVAE
jgi:uncharacterized protein (TIGR02145 family)